MITGLLVATVAALTMLLSVALKRRRDARERSVSIFAELPAVKIDADGGKKYVVCTVELAGHESRRVVRADKSAEYHADIVDRLTAEIANTDIVISKVRGGYIQHTPAEKLIVIDGTSQGYGRDDERQVTADMLRQQFPEYEVFWD